MAPTLVGVAPILTELPDHTQLYHTCIVSFVFCILYYLYFLFYNNILATCVLYFLVFFPVLQDNTCIFCFVVMISMTFMIIIMGMMIIVMVMMMIEDVHDGDNDVQ